MLLLNLLSVVSHSLHSAKERLKCFDGRAVLIISLWSLSQTQYVFKNLWTGCWKLLAIATVVNSLLRLFKSTITRNYISVTHFGDTNDEQNNTYLVIYLSLHKKWSFLLSFPSFPPQTVYLVTFTEEILNVKLHFLCSLHFFTCNELLNLKYIFTIPYTHLAFAGSDVMKKKLLSNFVGHFCEGFFVNCVHAFVLREVFYILDII